MTTKRRWGNGPVGRIYAAGDNSYFLQVYSRMSQVRRLPNKLRQLAEPEPVGFTEYKGRKSGSITTSSSERTHTRCLPCSKQLDLQRRIAIIYKTGGYSVFADIELQHQV